MKPTAPPKTNQQLCDSSSTLTGKSTNGRILYVVKLGEFSFQGLQGIALYVEPGTGFDDLDRIS